MKLKKFFRCHCASATHIFCPTCNGVRGVDVQNLPHREGALGEMTIFEGARLVCGACETPLLTVYRDKKQGERDRDSEPRRPRPRVVEPVEIDTLSKVIDRVTGRPPRDERTPRRSHLEMVMARNRGNR